MNGHTHVELEVEVTDGQVLVPSMLLITFIENAFKYGTSSEVDCTVRICVRVDDRRLFFETENKVIRVREDGLEGIGIENCRKRLELLYPGRYELKAGAENGMYCVSLDIRLRKED